MSPHTAGEEADAIESKQHVGHVDGWLLIVVAHEEALNAEAGEDQDIDLRITKEPEQMLVEQ